MCCFGIRVVASFYRFQANNPMTLKAAEHSYKELVQSHPPLSIIVAVCEFVYMRRESLSSAFRATTYLLPHIFFPPQRVYFSYWFASAFHFQSNRSTRLWLIWFLFATSHLWALRLLKATTCLWLNPFPESTRKRWRLQWSRCKEIIDFVWF